MARAKPDLIDLFGNGYVSARAHAMDWTATTIGAPETWSEGLLTAAGLCLKSAEPAALFVAPSFATIFNDAYAEQVLASHTEALGSDIASIVQGSNRDAVTFLKTVSEGRDPLGDASAFTALVTPHLASPPPGTSSCLEPVPMGDNIIGVMHRVRLGKSGNGTGVPDWHAVILHVAEALRDIESVPEALHVATAVMGHHLDLQRAGFATVEPDQDQCVVAAEWLVDPSVPSMRGHHRLSDFGPLVSAQMRAGDELFVGDVQDRINRFQEAYAAQFIDYDVRAMINIPIMRKGALVAVFFGHHAASRRWSPEAALLARDAAERAWSKVEEIEAQDKLQEMHVRLKLALEAGGLATWDWDILTDEVEWSPELFKLLGYTPSTIVPSFKAWTDRIYSDDLSETLAALDASRDERKVYEHTFRVVHPDGDIRWCSGRGIFFYADDATPMRMVGLLEDVTEAVAAEADLRDSKERFRLIVDSARDYAIFTTDADGLIDGWLPGAERVFGWTAEEAIGQHANILFVADDRANDVPIREMEEARLHGHASDVRWHRRKDGSSVFIDGSVRPLWHTSNQLRGYLTIGQDITQRRNDELALRRSEERFRVLTNTIPHMVFRGSATGERSWNSQQWLTFTGQSDIQATAFGWLSAIHPNDRTQTLAAWEEARNVGEYAVEHRIKRAEDDQYRWHQTRAVPAHHPDSSDHEWVGTSSDIHDRRQNQDHQDLMFAELQHRTYNLLAVVRAIFTETMNEAESLPAFRQHFTNRLTALSRVQSMLGSSDNGRATIGALLKLELDALAQDDQRISLSGPKVELKPSSIQILSLAVHELCTNALKYGALADQNGSLAVRWQVETRGDDDRCLKVVWDEHFGRNVSPPKKEAGSFGRQLIEYALPYQLRADTDYDLREDGLSCTLAIPLDERRSEPLT